MDTNSLTPEIHSFPTTGTTDRKKSETTNNDEETPSSWRDLYSVDWRPKEYFFKYRKRVNRFRVGSNLMIDLDNNRTVSSRFVLKPLSEDPKWKAVYETKERDLKLLSKKISIGPLLRLQVGLRHEFRNHTTGWMWKLTTVNGGYGVSQIQTKTTLPVLPGFDIRVGWSAEYELPDIHGGSRAPEPVFGINFGHLYGSIERDRDPI
ncbi:hypothetical protein KP509_37G024600 [Ceratopteris richardii]|uniref:DUF7781 domain-containing protein n=1 Tax=Ceratopteris richardii TaxID=49495 RepID=A0A8T2Q7F5_CERRI|nr:hypothetical protein KP509_37G024600 [Ceratopteris richardii]